MIGKEYSWEQDFDLSDEGLEIMENLIEKVKGEDKLIVWAVVYRNYEPVEVDSLWATEALARKRVEALGAVDDSTGWHIIQWKVGAKEPE